MKKLFYLATILVALNSCSRDNNESTPTEPKLILKTENLSFQDGEKLPEPMWLSASSSFQNDNMIITDGVKNYTYSTTNPHWVALPNTYQNTKKLGWCNVMYQYRLIHINGWNYLDNTSNDKIFYTSNNNPNDKSKVYQNPNPVKSAGFVNWNYGTYIAGGSDINGNYSKDVFELNVNPSSQSQTKVKITELPEAKETSIEVVNYKLYVIGGYNGTSSKRIDCFDLITKTWTFLGNMPYGFSSHSTCVQGAKIWIVGNYNLADQQLAYYNTATNEFVTVNSNITPRRHVNAEVLGNKLYVFSGATGSNSSSALTSMQVANLP